MILLHLINDAFVTWLAPLLPRLIREFDLSLAVAATLPATLALSTNLSQPIAAFHPPAAVVATREAPPQLRALWMSRFVTPRTSGSS